VPSVILLDNIAIVRGNFQRKFDETWREIGFEREREERER